MHDIDFEQWPQEHCEKAQQLLTELDIDPTVIHAVVSHGWGLCSDVEPERLMEKYLFAADEFTGLIGAAALMRPTGFEGMEVKSVMKKFKDKKFAAGCSRDVISQGAEMLGLTVQELAAEILPRHAVPTGKLAVRTFSPRKKEPSGGTALFCFAAYSSSRAPVYS